MEPCKGRGVAVQGRAGIGDEAGPVLVPSVGVTAPVPVVVAFIDPVGVTADITVTAGVTDDDVVALPVVVGVTVLVNVAVWVGVRVSVGDIVGEPDIGNGDGEGVGVRVGDGDRINTHDARNRNLSAYPDPHVYESKLPESTTMTHDRWFAHCDTANVIEEGAEHEGSTVKLLATVPQLQSPAGLPNDANSIVSAYMR